MSGLFDLERTPIEGGLTVVEASAGTGKTYCLTGLVLRLLLERRVQDVGKILVVTFTNAATEELVTRIRDALRTAERLLAGDACAEDADPFFRHLQARWGGDEESRRILRRALLAFDDLTVSTIHGFCRQVLEQAAFESGMPFEAELIDNDEPLLREAARDVWRHRLYPAGELVAAVAAQEGWLPHAPRDGPPRSASFLADYRLWRRHPSTEILPEPVPLPAAVAALETARDRLAAAWDAGALHRLIAPLQLKQTGPVRRETLASLLADADAFCRGDPGGLAALRSFTGEKLRKSVFKKHHGELAEHPQVALVDRFDAAVGTLRHALRAVFIAEVDARFDAGKRATATLAFDDLLRRLRDALGSGAHRAALECAVRERFEVALIDEFQDTDLVQYDIFRRLFGDGPLILIGDPKQAIYRFRGADIFAYLAARGEAQRIYTLQRNWRATRQLVEAVGAVFSHPPRPFVFRRIPFKPVDAAGRADGEPLAGDRGKALEWLWIPARKDKADALEIIRRTLASEVVRLLSGGLTLGGRPLQPRDLAVLVRTNAQAQAIQEALREARVPAVVGRAGDVFESDEMVELQRLASAIVDPGFTARLRAAWATRLWGDDAACIRRLNGDDAAWQERLELFEAYREHWLAEGFVPMIGRLIAERDARRRLLALPDGERRLTNLLHCVELLHREEIERRLSPAALVTWLAAERAGERRGESEREDTELRLESDAEAVQISTVHRSKGLEYEIVFCPFLWETFPTDKAPVLAHVGAERVVMDFDPEERPEHRALAEAEHLAEELRLAYVALTRARHRCYVVWCGTHQSRTRGSALTYLVPPAALDAEATAAASSQEPGEWAHQRLEVARQGAAGQESALAALVERHAAVMGLERITEPPPHAEWQPPVEAAAELRCYELPADLGRRLRPWATASFSSLVRSHQDRAAPPELPDHLDPATPPALRPAAPEAETARPEGIFAFARGTRAGTCLHEVLERCDFAALDDPATAGIIDAALRRHGLDDPARHAAAEHSFDPGAVVRALLERLAAAPLPGAGFPLAEVPREHMLVEWKFTAPLAGAAPRDLAALFRTHAEGAVCEVADDLETLSSAELQGFLTGFVDLTFTHDERWYVIDWKSNHLGDSRAAYDTAGMWRAMRHHQYVLQYHLYVLALDRFLRRRLPGYDYERHFGGVYYVFLRGLGESPQGTSETGWYVDRPPAALIAALASFVAEGEAP